MWVVGERRRLIRERDDARAIAERIANQAGIAAREYEEKIKALNAALRGKNSSTQP
jgi:hypothetical protein